MDRKNWMIAVVALFIGIGLVVAGFALARFMKPKDNPVPESVSSQIEFSPLVIPANTETPTTSDYKASIAEDGTRLLTYVIHIDGTTVTVSEYSQPSQFTDVPDFKSKFLQDVVQQTTSVSTSSGTIVLGQMAKQQNKQLGVMLERGLVVFLSPSKTLEQRQWRTIGDALDVVKPTN